VCCRRHDRAAPCRIPGFFRVAACVVILSQCSGVIAAVGAVHAVLRGVQWPNSTPHIARNSKAQTPPTSSSKVLLLLLLLLLLMLPPRIKNETILFYY
jgi:hypothetical protein